MGSLGAFASWREERFSFSFRGDAPLCIPSAGPILGSMDEQESQTIGTIEVDLFSQDVDDPEHPEAVRFRGLLETVATDYGCRLVAFSVHRGTVAFAFDDDVLTADILRELEMDYGGEEEGPLS